MLWKKLRSYILKILTAPLFFLLLVPLALHAAQGTVEVGLGKSVLLNLDMTLDRVSIPSPEIADVIVVSPRQILINGKSIGETSLILWGKGANVEIRDLKVHSNRDYKQIMLEVRFAEVDRSALKELGFDLFGFGNDVQLGSVGSNLGTVSFGTQSTTSGIRTGDAALDLGEKADLFLGQPANDLIAIVKALDQKGLIRILAEPNLVTLSGKEATFLSGGEFPVPVVQGAGTAGALATVTIEWKEFGVKLRFLPTVLDSQIINLDISPEISSLDFTSGVTLSGFTIPALRTRRSNVTVEMGDGETIAVGGLISRELVETISRTPLLGQMPILGALFRSTKYQQNETEMLMLVSPHIVKAYEAGQAPDLPDVYQWER